MITLLVILFVLILVAVLYFFIQGLAMAAPVLLVILLLPVIDYLVLRLIVYLKNNKD